MFDLVSCPCGSGLRQIRCCQAAPASLPNDAALALLDDAGAQATRLFNEKKTAEAEALALKLLDLAPNHRIPLRVLFEIRRAQSNMPAAEALARRLAALPNDNPQLQSAANLQLAQLIIGAGRFAEAEAPAAAALIATPRDVTAHHVMGVVLTETGRPRAGERHYRQSMALLGREDGMVMANTAWSLKLQGRLAEAAALYQRALALRPDNSRAVGGYAQVEMGRGNRAKAVSLLDDALARWPEDRTLRLLRILADIAIGDGAAVLARMSEPAAQMLPAELSAQGLALTLAGRQREAVGVFAYGKKLQRERYGNAYEPRDFIARANAYKAFFTSDRFAAVPRAVAGAGPQPVFILGFPRSGGSLLEQMLAQLPGFALGDDLFPIADLVAAVTQTAGGAPAYPEVLSRLMIADGPDIPAMLRDRYIQARVQAGLGAARFITDRGADLFWHLGLIKLLFPEAPIIHVIRHPLDVMLSNFSQERRLEANCGVSLDALARHYDLTMSMIRHYRGQLTLRYLPVRYEDLVADPAGTLARVGGFIGIDPAAVPPASTLAANAAAADPTPAHFAMREPLHGRGRYRHLALAAELPGLFTDVRPLLDPWIAELGYGDVA